MKSDEIIKILAKQKRFTLKVEGTSMLPILRPDDILSLQKTNFSQLEVNDIALVIKKRQPIIHRVIFKAKEYLVTRGDHQNKSDGIIKPSQVYSKVVGVKRGKQSFFLSDYYLIQSSRYFEAISQLADKLTENKIKYVILKGLPVHLYYENTHPQRLYADCDIFVGPLDFLKAHKILLQLDYLQSESYLSPIQKWFGIKPKEYSYFSKHGNLSVIFDIHTEVLFLMNQMGNMNAFYPDYLQQALNKEFLNAGKMIDISGRKLFILEPAHLALYLALHFFHHSFKGIFRLKLLDAVLKSKKHKVDFNLLQQLINKYQLQTFIYPVFMLLNRYYPRAHNELIFSELKKFKLSSPFDGENRVSSGIKRLKVIFLFSPQSSLKKLSFFLKPAVILTALWVLFRKITILIDRNSVSVYNRSRKKNGKIYN